MGIFDRMISAVWYRFGKYGISVKIKDTNKVIIAADVFYDKLTCLIGAYFANYRLTINLSVMRTQTWCFLV